MVETLLWRPTLPRARFALGLGFVVVVLSACSGPIDLLEETHLTRVRTEGAPLENIQLHLKADMRPHEERGVRKYVGVSYVGGNAFTEPTAVSLLRIFARDLVRAGVAERVSFSEEEPPFRIDLVIEHLAGSFSEGFQTLPIILPTSAIHGVCQLRIEFKDRDGRVFLAQSFFGEKRQVGALLTGLEDGAAGALADAIRATLDQILPALKPAVRAFWDRQRASGP